jgi:hypothetical protein
VMGLGAQYFLTAHAGVSSGSGRRGRRRRRRADGRLCPVRPPLSIVSGHVSGPACGGERSRHPPCGGRSSSPPFGSRGRGSFCPPLVERCAQLQGARQRHFHVGREAPLSSSTTAVPFDASAFRSWRPISSRLSSSPVARGPDFSLRSTGG